MTRPLRREPRITVHWSLLGAVCRSLHTYPGSLTSSADSLTAFVGQYNEFPVVGSRAFGGASNDWRKIRLLVAEFGAVLARVRAEKLAKSSRAEARNVVEGKDVSRGVLHPWPNDYFGDGVRP